MAKGRFVCRSAINHQRRMPAESLMNHAPITSSTSNLNAGRMRPGSSPAPLRPLFLGDWLDALFIHYQVDAERLQREVPYQLDLFEGRAFVSLVAFKMRRLRPAFGGWLAETLFKPIANTAYLNVRTYVRNGMEPGIYFIAEFLSNPLCIPLGPKTFGLPYHLGRLKYARDLREGVLEGRVRHWRRGAIQRNFRPQHAIATVRARFTRRIPAGTLHGLHDARPLGTPVLHPP